MIKNIFKKEIFCLLVIILALQKQIGLSVFAVTPRAGVWIETLKSHAQHRRSTVTPRAGVWIETAVLREMPGAKSVTPRAGVWIETP